MRHHSHRIFQAGYNLIGVSLFIVVLGVMIAGGLGLKQKYDWAKRKDISAENMDAVRVAMKNYQLKNGRLPCPAPLDAPLDSARFGRETDCSAAAAGGTFEDAGTGGELIRYGAIPVRTLEVSDSLIADGWSHRYIYAVTKYYTVGAPDYNLNKGAIDIRAGKDTKGKTQSLTSKKGNVIYALLSPGADKRGAYTLGGTLLNEEKCSGTNCLDDKDGRLQLSLFRQYDMAGSAANNDFTATMTYEASSISYEWRAKKWGKCGCNNPTEYPVGRCEIEHAGKIGEVNTIAGPSAPCIAGTQFNVTEKCCDKPKKTREVTCHNKATDEEVDDKYCAKSLKPATSEDCAQYCWTVPQYQPCPTHCSAPPSVQPLVPDTLYCQVNNKDEMAHSACVEDNRPAGFVYCPPTEPCPPPPENPGGGYVDTDGDGRGDTHIRDMPNGYSGPSSNAPGGLTDGTSEKDSSGNYTGDHDNGDTGWNPVQQW